MGFLTEIFQESRKFLTVKLIFVGKQELLFEAKQDYNIASRKTARLFWKFWFFGFF